MFRPRHHVDEAVRSGTRERQRPSAQSPRLPDRPGQDHRFADEPRDPDVDGLAIEDFRGRDLGHDAAAQHRDLNAHRKGFRLVVGHEQGGGARGREGGRDRLARLDPNAASSEENG